VRPLGHCLSPRREKQLIRFSMSGIMNVVFSIRALVNSRSEMPINKRLSLKMLGFEKLTGKVIGLIRLTSKRTQA
jgi:hypothetical protein